MTLGASTESFRLILQTVESQLAIRVASLLQERVALSIENSKLKQQVARVRREKLTAEGKLTLAFSLIIYLQVAGSK